jgi:hypothetical protein
MKAIGCFLVCHKSFMFGLRPDSNWDTDPGSPKSRGPRVLLVNFNEEFSLIPQKNFSEFGAKPSGPARIRRFPKTAVKIALSKSIISAAVGKAGGSGSYKSREEPQFQQDASCNGLSLTGGCAIAAYNGDIRCRKEVSEPLVHDVRQGVHARKVMESYQTWFGEGPELSVLRILGLFDRPADEKALDAS